MARLFPSLIAADLLNLGQVIATLDSYCDGFHLDIMDNHFVPNITFGADMANAIDRASRNPSWVHLMIENPAEFIPKLILKPQSIITFHIEGCKDPKTIIQAIHAQGCKAGIALKPSTPLETIIVLLPLLDHVLVMSVEPGFSGQVYKGFVESKIRELVEYNKAHQLSIRIGIDGGVNPQNIQQLKKIGVEDFAIASALFKSTEYKEVCKTLRDLIKNS